MPDGVLTLYEPGTEGPLWYGPEADPVRGLPKAGILDRCTVSNTCPKIIEHFGAAEVWGQKLTPEWVGTAGDKDLPLPPNVRRYYIPSTQHGGGRGGFSVTPAAAPVCPTTNYGTGLLRRQPRARDRNCQCDPGSLQELGDARYAAAGQRVAASCRSHPGGGDEGSDGVPDYSRTAANRADRTGEPAARLRLGTALQLR
jgi:hypothetical protein